VSEGPAATAGPSPFHGRSTACRWEGVNVDDLVLVQGTQDTRLALARWNMRPWSVLRVWRRKAFKLKKND